MRDIRAASYLIILILLLLVSFRDFDASKQIKALQFHFSIANVKEETNHELVESNSGGKVTEKQKRAGKFAYAFIVAGCTTDSCLGYVLNVIVASQILQEFNSIADVVLKVQMRAGQSRLSDQQEAWLSSANVKLEYLNGPTSISSFGMATILKFKVFQMLEYDRVLFLDADLIPICNLDYMFHESYNDNGMLEDLVVINGAVCPATANFFMVTPKEGEFERIKEIIQKYRVEHNGSLKFDYENGWGHRLQYPDHWTSFWMRKDGHHWDYYASNSDQGLLHYYARYTVLNYTQLTIRKVETWSKVQATNTNLAWFQDLATNVPEEKDHPTIPVGAAIPVDNSTFLAKIDERDSSELPTCGGAQRIHQRGEYMFAPYSDHLHFGGGGKPWNQNISAAEILSHQEKISDNRALWLHHLGKANSTFGMNLESIIVPKQKNNPLGSAAFDKDVLDPNAELPKRRKRLRL